MQFPIQIVFKLLAFPRRCTSATRPAKTSVTSSRSCWPSRKRSPSSPIGADRVIDFNAEYHFANPQGVRLGSAKRSGMRSLWKAHYLISVGDNPAFEVHEESAFVRLIDGAIGEIPIVGMLSGYFFNPVYLVTRTNGSPALRMVKQRALLESIFTIEKQAVLGDAEQEAVMLGLMMIILLERSRG